jgi:dipeptidyl aminopeptidase/acylaminoacyl peptidase
LFILGILHYKAPNRHRSRVPNHQPRVTSFSDLLLILITASCLRYGAITCDAQQTTKRFTVADEIALTLFDAPNGRPPEVRFSPDENYFAVWTERGLLDRNRVEDSLRLYRSNDVVEFLAHSDRSQSPSPVWIVSRSDKEGPVINAWRWLPDSGGLVFLDQGEGGFVGRRLVLADLRSKSVAQLTSAKESVEDFDIRDRQHYVYTVADRAPLQKLRDELRAPAIVGTGRSLWALLFPNEPTFFPRGNSLWAAIEGKHFEVRRDGETLVLDKPLALSPDGGSLVTALPVSEVPPSWETLYPPPYASDSYRIRPGQRVAHQYVRIDLKAGLVQALTSAPISGDAGWSVSGSPSWSSDGKAILLPGTFLQSKNGVPSRPCVAVVDLPSNLPTCVEALKAETETGYEQGYHFVIDSRFIEGDNRRVLVVFDNSVDHSLENTEYLRTFDRGWQVVGQGIAESEAGRSGLTIEVRESYDEPPLLVAKNKGKMSRVIWDPNPQLKNIELGQASIYTWKDKEGRTWKAGLYKPSDYSTEQRYPLVIQTHGFWQSQFRPSGMFTTSFAARELAEAGIIVLQVPEEQCPQITPGGGKCAVARYESAANQLVLDGLVDPDKIGMIGFSATCFYVMEALTTGTFHLKAASITDGKLVSYMQYMTLVDLFGNDPLREFDSMIGAKPFGEGLQQWLKRSPGFNLDKVTAPLLVVGESRVNMLNMWEPYAGLRLLHKPVELMMLNTDLTQHILTNPAVRMASQGGSVDWFRFWLQDYEDPDPAKAEQYARWRVLRSLQSESENNMPAPRSASN